jgi:Zn-dependent peptidase ImmA (M78 family)
LRQRFTIAHELGHYQLHLHSANEIFVDKDFIVKYRSEKKYSETEIRQEREANQFAAELLMPREFIKAEIIKKKYQRLSEMEFLEKLAKTFDVSVAAMTIRANDLDLF